MLKTIRPTVGRVGTFNIYVHAGRCSSAYVQAGRRTLVTATNPKSSPSVPKVPSTLTQSDAASTVNIQTSGVNSKVHGDWVLFHPVYTPEELNAVEVSWILPRMGYVD